MTSDVVLQPISEAALVNPPLTRVVGPDDEVSFIPMAAGSDSGQWVEKQTRRQREVSVGYTSFEEDDVLFAKITPCMENGKGCHAIGLMNGIGYGSTEFHVLRAESGTDSRFLYHWIMTEAVRKKAEAFMIGSAGQQRVQASFFDFFRIPKLNEGEQQFASHILDAADEAIAKTEALIAKLKAIKQGLLHDLLTRGLDENGELRDPERHPEKFIQTPLGVIPKSWEIVPLGDLADVIVGGTPSTAVSAFWGGDIPWTSSGDVHLRRISDVPGRITEKGLSSSNAKLVDSPAVVIALAGQGKTRGTVAITLSRICGNQSVAFLKSRNDNLNPYYLFHNLDIRYEELRARSAGGGRAGLSKGILEVLPVPVPETQEQERIAKILDVADDTIAKTEALLKKRIAIKKGLMQDLLTGRVRITAHQKGGK